MPGRSICIELDDWLVEEFCELEAKYPFFSETQLALILFEYALDDSDVLKTAFAPFAALAMQAKGDDEPKKEDVCSGSCTGKDKVQKTVDNACPDPCDPDIIKAMAKTAKKEARKKAINACLEKHEDCICADGTYKVSKKCVTQTIGDSKFCYYKVKAKYSGGKCKRVA